MPRWFSRRGVSGRWGELDCTLSAFKVSGVYEASSWTWLSLLGLTNALRKQLCQVCSCCYSYCCTLQQLLHCCWWWTHDQQQRQMGCRRWWRSMIYFFVDFGWRLSPSLSPSLSLSSYVCERWGMAQNVIVDNYHGLKSKSLCYVSTMSYLYFSFSSTIDYKEKKVLLGVQQLFKVSKKGFKFANMLIRALTKNFVLLGACPHHMAI